MTFSLADPLFALPRRLKQRANKLGRTLRQRLYHRGPSRAAFVVGCGRSGTSLVVFRLASSWQVYLFNEDNPVAFANFRLRSLDQIAALLGQGRAPILLFKPILDSHRSVQLLERFPTARLLFCIRHVDDVVNSSLKRFGRENRLAHVRRWMEDDFAELADPPPPPATKALVRALWRPDLSPESGAALFWLFYNSLYFDLTLDQEVRCLLVPYERLVGAAPGTLQRLCAFLEIDFEPTMAAHIFASSVGRDRPPTLDPAVRAACEALWVRLVSQAVG